MRATHDPCSHFAVCSLLLYYIILYYCVVLISCNITITFHIIYICMYLAAECCFCLLHDCCCSQYRIYVILVCVRMGRLCYIILYKYCRCLYRCFSEIICENIFKVLIRYIPFQLCILNYNIIGDTANLHLQETIKTLQLCSCIIFFKRLNQTFSLFNFAYLCIYKEIIETFNYRLNL